MTNRVIVFTPNDVDKPECICGAIKVFCSFASLRAILLLRRFHFIERHSRAGGNPIRIIRSILV
jgi:hypothetical protein